MPVATSPVNTVTENESEGSDASIRSGSDSEVNKAIDKIYTSFGSAAALSAGIQKYVRRKRSLGLHKQRKTG